MSFNAKRGQKAQEQAAGRPPCTWCRKYTARGDHPWCDHCFGRYLTLPMADFNAEFRHPGPQRALPRVPGAVIHGARQVAEAMRPGRAAVREWAAQMGIDDADLDADRAWRSEHGGSPVLPAPGRMEDGRPEPPESQAGVSDGAQDAQP